MIKRFQNRRKIGNLAGYFGSAALLALSLSSYVSLAVAEPMVKPESKGDIRSVEKPHSGPPLVLEKLIEEAYESNPRLRQSHHQSLAQKARIGPAGTLPDPRVEYSYSNYPVDSWEAGESGMTGRELRLKQAFPFPGKLEHKEDAAEFRFQRSKQEVEAIKWEVRSDVKEAFYKLYAVHKKITLIKSMIQAFEQLEQSALSKYKVGRGILQDISQARVQVAENKRQLLILQSERTRLEGDLNVLLNQSAHRPLGQPVEAPVTQIDFRQVSMMGLATVAEDNDPRLKAQAFDVAAEEQELSYAKKGYFPDFEVSAGYRFRENNAMDEGQDLASASIGMNIPLFFFSKQNEQEKEALQELKAAELGLVRTQRHLEHAIHHLYVKVKNHFEMLNLYQNELIPEAEKALASSESAYRVNKVDFLTVINNERTVFNLRMAYYDTLAEYEVALAHLEARLAKPIHKIATSLNKGSSAEEN